MQDFFVVNRPITVFSALLYFKDAADSPIIYRSLFGLNIDHPPVYVTRGDILVLKAFYLTHLLYQKVSIVALS